MKNLLIFLLLSSVISCNKPQVPKYTVSGRIMHDSTHYYTNLGVQMYVQTSKSYGIPQDYKDLGSATIGSDGRFSITYDQTTITNKGAFVYIQSDFFLMKYLPVNQSISRDFRLDDWGMVQINLHPSTKLGPNDTLYLCYFLYPDLTKIQMDTITKDVNGFYKIIKQPIPLSEIDWGIGSRELKYNFITKKFINRKNRVDFNIQANPFLNSITIDY